MYRTLSSSKHARKQIILQAGIGAFLQNLCYLSFQELVFYGICTPNSIRVQEEL
jgi:hypothetical protein